MSKKGLKVAVLAACVMGVTASVAYATPPDLDGSVFTTFNGPPGPKPPPKLSGADPVTNPPGPRPPPKLDGGPKGTTPPPK